MKKKWRLNESSGWECLECTDLPECRQRARDVCWISRHSSSSKNTSTNTSKYKQKYMQIQAKIQGNIQANTRKNTSKYQFAWVSSESRRRLLNFSSQLLKQPPAAAEKYIGRTIFEKYICQYLRNTVSKSEKYRFRQIKSQLKQLQRLLQKFNRRTYCICIYICNCICILTDDVCRISRLRWSCCRKIHRQDMLLAFSFAAHLRIGQLPKNFQPPHNLLPRNMFCPIWLRLLSICFSGRMFHLDKVVFQCLILLSPNIRLSGNWKGQEHI